MARQSGITQHSSAENNWFIFSTDTGHSYDDRDMQHMESYLFQQGISYKKLEGMYNKKCERSFIVNMRHYPLLRDRIKGHGQESVLLLHNHKHGLYKASLDYLREERTQPIGFFRAVPKSVAMRHDSWTYDPKLNAWFIVTPTDDTRMNRLEELGLTG